MKSLISILLVSFTTQLANAETSAMLFVRTDDSQGQLLINESGDEGPLSRLFEQMKVEESGDETKRTKSLILSNERFGFICNKARLTEVPSTSCTFMIASGENTADVNTFISKEGTKKVAMIGMTPFLSKEIAGIFPADENGKVDYILEFSNGVRLEVDGSPDEVFTIGFFQN